MGSLSIWHWLIVLVVVVLVFGTKKLRNVGQDLGGAVKGFKEGMKEATEVDEEKADNITQQVAAEKENATTAAVDAKTIDVKATDSKD